MDLQEIAKFEWYTGNLDWLRGRTIYLGKAGSHAYGTNTPTSDVDLKGVCIAPRRYYLGALETFEQAEFRQPFDGVIYDIKKFFQLAWDCNPNIIEQLWTDEADWVLPGPDHNIHSTKWLWVLEERDLFLSKKAQHTFSGYAHAQMKRIKTHRKWLLHPPKAEPRRADFGLPEGAPTLGKEQMGVVNAKIRKYEDHLAGEGLSKDKLEDDAIQTNLVHQALKDLSLDANLLPIVYAERRFAGASREWAQYQTWKTERNAVRSELERQHGYDTKHGMHLVRLMRMGIEILSGRGVVVKRPDAEELLAIRGGAWSFDQLEEWFAGADAELQAVAKTSTLPHGADKKTLNQVLVDILEASP